MGWRMAQKPWVKLGSEERNWSLHWYLHFCMLNLNVLYFGRVADLSWDVCCALAASCMPRMQSVLHPRWNPVVPSSREFMACRFSSWGYVCNMRLRVCVCPKCGLYALLNSQLTFMLWKLWWKHILGNLWHGKGSLSHVWKFGISVSVLKGQLFGFGMEHVFCNSLCSQVLHLICHKFRGSALTWQSLFWAVAQY